MKNFTKIIKNNLNKYGFEKSIPRLILSNNQVQFDSHNVYKNMVHALLEPMENFRLTNIFLA